MSFGVVMQQRHFTINYSKERNLQKLPREIQHTIQPLSTEYEKTHRKLRADICIIFVVVVLMLMLQYLKKKFTR